MYSVTTSQPTPLDRVFPDYKLAYVDLVARVAAAHAHMQACRPAAADPEAPASRAFAELEAAMRSIDTFSRVTLFIPSGKQKS